MHDPLGHNYEIETYTFGASVSITHPPPTTTMLIRCCPVESITADGNACTVAIVADVTFTALAHLLAVSET